LRHQYLDVEFVGFSPGSIEAAKAYQETTLAKESKKYPSEEQLRHQIGSLFVSRVSSIIA